MKAAPRELAGDRDPRFLLNGKPVFINGTCEYEHLLGWDHAFSDEQILTRMKQIKGAGFNALRMAHHLHNLRYLEWCDEMGLLTWTQVGAHLSFDTVAFRENYRVATREMVRERRNSPSIVLWGIQNESVLPTVFGRELTEIVRELDPTASAQRKTNTCNGGTGTDWNIPQNWLGTYGGNANDYAEALVEQQLVGEYGQWRTHGLHVEGDWNEQWGREYAWQRDIPEEVFTYCLETKVRLGEQVKDRACGHFQWIFNTHANPGRSADMSKDGVAPSDVGVANHKGLISSWGEPISAYYMYRSNYVPVEEGAMVYIAMHSWPDRWSEPGVKDEIVVFSNCDEVELFNDLGAESLGVRQRGPIGTHMSWEGAEIKYDTLYSVGRVNGEVVATDTVKLTGLPAAPRQAELEAGDVDNTAPRGEGYVYRVNCGGEDYEDVHGNVWVADREWEAGSGEWGSVAWVAEFPELGLDPRYGNQRRTWDPVWGTRDDEMHQTYRYGREELRYRFPVEDGAYEVELYFAEPWFGIGGGWDCEGYRIFDVAVNGELVADDLDLWARAGSGGAVKLVAETAAEGGMIEVSFPEMKSYQAVISGIAVRKAR